MAEQLNNTPSVCRKCYIHPTVIEAYLAAPPKTLSAAERGMLAFLHGASGRAAGA